MKFRNLKGRVLQGLQGPARTEHKICQQMGFWQQVGGLTVSTHQLRS